MSEYAIATMIWMLAGAFLGAIGGYVIGRQTGYSRGRSDGWHQYDHLRSRYGEGK